MLKVLVSNPTTDREIALRIARAKSVTLTERGIEQVSKLARELIDLGFRASDAFDAAIHHKFQLADRERV